MIKKLFIILLTLSTTSIAENDIPLETVSKVDLTRYSGTWYEIAKIPNSFQKKCVSDTTATYGLSDNNRISVLNKCVDKNGKIVKAEGVSKIEDNDSNSKLKVSFVSIFGWNLFWGDYWIIGLGDEYEYAIIGHPERKYGWILSRTPQLSKEKQDEIFSIIKKSGYNPDNFEFTKQTI